MQFTVAIVTCNRADSLAEGLAALAAQDFPFQDVEVVVADNGSRDETRAVCDRMAARFPNFQYIYDARPGQLVGWHRALAVATGDIACFIDDDVRPQPSWLAALAETYSDARVGMATGPIRPSYDGTPPDWLDHLRLGDPGAETNPFLGLLDAGSKPLDIPGNFVWGSNFTVRRQLLINVGGFHPCAMPWNLIRFYGDGEVYVGRTVAEQGHRVVYHPEAAVIHAIPDRRLTLESVHAKFVSAGCARSYQFLRQSGELYDFPSDDDIEGIASRYFRDASAVPAELRTAVTQGLTDGLRMHCDAFQNDPAFRDWVACETYLDLDRCYTHPALQPADGTRQATDWRVGGSLSEGANG